MDEASILTGTEELTEVEGLFLIAILTHQAPQIVGIDTDRWQDRIGIGIT